MAATWWNPAYLIRKQLTLENLNPTKIAAGSSLFVVIDATILTSLNKVRSDYEDIEVLFYDSKAATPSWSVLGRVIDYGSSDGSITISFPAVNDIITTDSDYYLYYCNSTLKDQPTRPAFVETEFSDSATVENGGIMLTRPTEDWESGASKSVNARAAFAFYGKKIRLSFQNRADGGIVEVVSATGALPALIDTYSLSGSVDYDIEYDTVDRHIVRMRATGNKNPSSSDSVIEIAEILYSKYTEGSLGTEEIYTASESIRTTVGS